MKITDFIPYGKENAISNNNLAIASGTDERKARRLVHQARANGEPICSTSEERKGGYFMPANEFEARIYYRQQRSRIKSAIAALNGVKKYLKERSSGNGQ